MFNSNGVVGVALAAVVLSTYLQTLFPGVPPGDSGELLAAACNLGVAHPPGYPLFILLGHVAMQVLRPLGHSPAWCMNALNAGFGAAAAVAVYATVLALQPPPPAAPMEAWATRALAAASGAAYAFSPLVWLYSVGAEVFALNNCCVAVMVLLVVRYCLQPTVKRVVFGAWFFGLTLCNQHTAVLFEIPFVAIIVLTEAVVMSRLTARAVAVYAAAFFSGLLPYAFLPLSDLVFAARGSWGDISTLSGFVHHFRRADYGSLALYSGRGESPRPPEGFAARTALFVQDFALVQFPAPFAVLAAWGSVAILFRRVLLPRQRQKEPRQSRCSGETLASIALLLAVTVYLGVFHTLSNMPLSVPLLFGIHQRFWMQPNVVMCVWLGVGAVDAFRLLLSRLPGAKRASATLATVAAVCAIVLLRHRSFAVSDQSNNTHFEEYARAVLEPVPRASLVATHTDETWFPLLYLQACEGFRPDVTVVNSALMTYTWFAKHQVRYDGVAWPGARLCAHGSAAHSFGTGYTVKEFVDANLAGGNFSAVFWWGDKTPWESDRSHEAVYSFQRHGLLAKAIPKPVTLQDVLDSERSWDAVREAVLPLADPIKYDLTTWEAAVARRFHDAQLEQGVLMLQWATANKAGSLNVSMVVKAAALFEDSLPFIERVAIKASVVDNILKNVGYALDLVAHVDPAVWPVEGDGMMVPPWAWFSAPTPVDTVASLQHQLALRSDKHWSALLARVPPTNGDFDTIRRVLEARRRARDTVTRQ